MKAAIVICVVSILAQGCTKGTDDWTASSFSLTCSGVEHSEFVVEGIRKPEQRGSEITFVLRWDVPRQMLTVERTGTEPEVLCSDRGAEKCSAKVIDGQIIAHSFDMKAGNAPDSVSSFSERYDINLTTLDGKSILQTSSGTVTETNAEVSFKHTVSVPVKCQRLA